MNTAKSPGPQNVEFNPGGHQEEVMHALDMVELLLDISSRLQAT